MHLLTQFNKRRPGLVFPKTVEKISAESVITAIDNIDTSNRYLFDTNYNSIENEIKKYINDYKIRIFNSHKDKDVHRADIEDNSKELDATIVLIQQYLKENMEHSFPITLRKRYEDVNVSLNYLSFLRQKIIYDKIRLENLINVAKPQIIPNVVDDNYHSTIQKKRWIRNHIRYWNNLYIPRYVKGNVSSYNAQYKVLQKQILDFLATLNYEFSVVMLNQQVRNNTSINVDDNSVKTIAQLHRFIQTCCQ